MDIDDEEWNRKLKSARGKFANYKKQKKKASHNDANTSQPQKFEHSSVNFKDLTCPSELDNPSLFCDKRGSKSSSSCDSFLSASSSLGNTSSNENSSNHDEAVLSFGELSATHLFDTISEGEISVESQSEICNYSSSDIKNLYDYSGLEMEIDKNMASKEISVSILEEKYKKKIKEYQNALNQRNEAIAQLSERLKVAIKSQKLIQSDSNEQVEQFTSKIQSLQLELEQASDILKKQKDKAGEMNSLALFNEKRRSSQLESELKSKDQHLVKLNEQVQNLTKELIEVKANSNYEIENYVIKLNEFETECQKLKVNQQQSSKEIQQMMGEKELLQKKIHDANQIAFQAQDNHDKDLLSLRSELDEHYGKQISLIREECKKVYQADVDRIKAEKEELNHFLEASKNELKLKDAAMNQKLQELKSSYEDEINGLKNNQSIICTKLINEIDSLKKKEFDLHHEDSEDMLNEKDLERRESQERHELNCKELDECTSDVKLLHSESDLMKCDFKNDTVEPNAKTLSICTLKDEIEVHTLNCDSVINSDTKALEDALTVDESLMKQSSVSDQPNSGGILSLTDSVIVDVPDNSHMDSDCCSSDVYDENLVVSLPHGASQNQKTVVSSLHDTHHSDEEEIESLMLLNKWKDAPSLVGYLKSVIEEKLKLENRKQITLELEVSQLNDLCNTYNVVHTELKNEAENLKKQYEQLISSQNLLSDDNSSKCYNCQKLQSKLKSEKAMKNVMQHFYMLKCREAEIDKQHIIDEFNNKIKMTHTSCEEKFMLSKLQEIDNIRTEFISDNKKQLETFKKELESELKSSYKIKLLEIEKVNLNQLEESKIHHENKLVCGWQSSSNKAQLNPNDELHSLDELSKEFDLQLEKAKENLTPQQVDIVTKVCKAMEKVHETKLVNYQMQSKNELQNALQEERLRLRSIQESQIEFMKMENEAKYVKNVHKMKESRARCHKTEINRLSEKYESQIKVLSEELDEMKASQKSAVNQNYDQLMLEVKRKFCDEIQHHVKESSFTWMKKYFDQISNINQQLELQIGSKINEDETKFLLEAKEKLIDSAEGMNRFVSNFVLQKKAGIQNSSPNLLDSSNETSQLEMESAEKDHLVMTNRSELDDSIKEIEQLKTVKEELTKANVDLHKQLEKQSSTLVLKDKKFDEDLKSLNMTLETKYEEEITNIREYYEKQLSQASFVQQWNESLDTSIQYQYTKKQVDEMLERVDAKNDEKINHLILEHNKRQKDLEDRFQLNISELKQGHYSEIQSIHQQYNAEITKIQMECAAEMARLMNDQENDIKKLHLEIDEEKNLMRNEYDSTRLKELDMRRLFETKMNEMESNHRAEMERMKESLDEVAAVKCEMADLQDEYEKYQRESKDRIKSLNEKKTNEMTNLRNEVETIWRDRIQVIQSDMTELADKERKTLVAKHTEEIQHLNKLLQDKESHLKSTLDNFEASGKTILDLENRMKKDKEMMDDVKEKIDKATEKYNDLVTTKENEFKLMESKYDELMSTCNLQKVTIDDLVLKLQDEHEHHELEIVTKMDELTKKLTEESNLSACIKEEKLVASHKCEMDKLKTKIRNIEVSLEDKEDEINKLKNELKSQEEKFSKDRQNSIKIAITEFEEANSAVLSKRENLLLKKIDELKKNHEDELNLIQSKINLTDSSVTNVNAALNEELKKFKALMDDDSNREKIHQLMSQVSALKVSGCKDEVNKLKQNKEFCDQQIVDEIKRYEEIVSSRERDNTEFGNIITSLRSDRDTVQQSNAHLMHILSELVRTFISIEDVINKHLKVQIKEDHKVQDQTENAEVSVEELGDIVEFNEEGFELMPVTLPEEIFRGPSIDLISEDVIFGVGKRVFAAVENLLTMIPTENSDSKSTYSKCPHCEELMDRLDSEINSKDKLALETHKMQGLISGLEAEKNGIEVEKQELEAKIHAVISELNQARHNITELASDKQIFCSQLQSISQSLGDQEKKLLEENERLHRKIKEEVGEHELQMQKLEKKICDLETSAEEHDVYYEKILKDKNNELFDLQKQIEAMDKLVKADKKFIEELTLEREQERDEFQKELEKLTEMIKDKEKVENLEKKLSKQVESLEEQIFEKISEQTEHHSVKESLVNRLNNTQVEVTNMKSMVDDLECQLETKNNNEKYLQEELLKLKRLLSQNCEFQEELNLEMAELRENSSSYTEIDALESISYIRALKDQMKQMRTSASLFDDFKAQIHVVDKKLDIALKQIEKFDVEEDDGIRERVKSPIEIKDSTSADDVHILDEKIEQMLMQIEKFKSKYKALRIKHEQSKTNEEELFQDKQQLQKELDNQRLKVSALRGCMQQRQQSIASPSKQMDSLEEELSQSKEFHLNLHKEFTVFKVESEAKVKSLEDQLTSSLKSTHELTAQLALSKDEMEKIQSIVISLKKQLKKAEEMIGTCDHQFENETVNGIIESHESEVKILQSRLKDLEETVATLEKRNLKIVEEQLKENELKCNYDKLVQEMDDCKKSLETANVELDKSRGQLSKMNRQLESAISRYDDSNRESLSLKTKIVSLNDQLEKMTSLLNSVREAELTSKTEIANLLLELENLTDESKKDKDKILEQEHRIEVLTGDITSMSYIHDQELSKLKLDLKDESKLIIERKDFLSSMDSSKSNYDFELSLSKDGDEQFLPQSIIKLLKNAHERGLQLLTLSELQSLREQLSISFNSTSALKSLFNDLQIIKNEVDNLQKFISKLESKDIKMNEFMEAISKIFNIDRKMYTLSLDAYHLETANKPPELDIFKEKLDAMESYQTNVMDGLAKAIHFMNDDSARNFSELELMYQEERRKLTLQIAALERNSSITEWQLKRKVKCLLLKLERESKFSSETRESLEEEKKRILQITSELNREKSKSSQFEHEYSLTNAELSKLHQQFTSFQEEMTELRNRLDSERKRNQDLTRILETERSNFTQLQATVNSERRLSSIAETRHKQVIEELRRSLDSERNTSLQMKRVSSNESTSLLVDSNGSIQWEKQRKRSCESPEVNGMQLEIENFEMRDSIWSLHRSPNAPSPSFRQLSNLSWNRVREADEYSKYKDDAERFNQEILRLSKQAEIDKREKEKLELCLKETEAEKVGILQTCVSLQRNLESLKSSHQHILDEHETYLKKNSSLLESMELKCEKQRQRMRELEMEVEKKNEDGRILESKLEESNKDKASLSKELESVKKHICLLSPAHDETNGVSILEMMRQKLLLIAHRLGSANSPSTANISSFIEELKNLEMENVSSFDGKYGAVIANNSELMSLVLSLSEDKLKLKDEISDLKDRCSKVSQNDSYCDRLDEDMVTQKLASERSSWAQERAELYLALHRAEMMLQKKMKSNDSLPFLINSNELKNYHYRYLKAESLRKALIYQKKFLLFLLSGYQDSEKITLSILTKMSGQSSNLPEPTSHHSHSRGFHRFRSATIVIIALCRMKFMVRRWSNILSERNNSDSIQNLPRLDQNLNFHHCRSGDASLEDVDENSRLHYCDPIYVQRNIENVPENCVHRLQSLHRTLGLQTELQIED